MRKKEDTFFEFISKLLGLFAKYDKRELSNFRNRLEEIRSSGDFRVKPRNRYVKKRGEQAKNEIIGGLPKVFLSKKYFPKNLDIDAFARRHLSIHIPQPHKKSRPELIGIVITKVAELKPEELNSFNKVLKEVLARVDEGKVDDFFLEWEKAIHNLKFK